MKDNSIVYSVGDEKLNFVFRLDEGGDFSAEVTRPRAPKRSTTVAVKKGVCAYSYRGPAGTEKKDPVATKLERYAHECTPRSLLELAGDLTKRLETYALTTATVFVGVKAMEETKPDEDFKEVLKRRFDATLGKKKETLAPFKERG